MNETSRPVVSAKQVALLAYRAATDEAVEIQQRMAMRPLRLETHGADRALPLREFTRRMLSRQEMLTNAANWYADEAEMDRKRLAVLMPIIEGLEAMFAEQREADDQAFAASLAEHLRRGGWGRR